MHKHFIPRPRMPHNRRVELINERLANGFPGPADARSPEWNCVTDRVIVKPPRNFPPSGLSRRVTRYAMCLRNATRLVITAVRLRSHSSRFLLIYCTFTHENSLHGEVKFQSRVDTFGQLELKFCWTCWESVCNIKRTWWLVLDESNSMVEITSTIINSCNDNNINNTIEFLIQYLYDFVIIYNCTMIIYCSL